VLTSREPLEHCPASLVTQCVKNEVKAEPMLFNHKVECIDDIRIVNRLVECSAELQPATLPSPFTILDAPSVNH
jgi:hypothetical protein